MEKIRAYLFDVVRHCRYSYLFWEATRRRTFDLKPEVGSAPQCYLMLFADKSAPLHRSNVSVWLEKMQIAFWRTVWRRSVRAVFCKRCPRCWDERWCSADRSDVEGVE